MFRALLGLVLATSLAHAAPSAHIDGDMPRLDLPPPASAPTMALPKASRARLEEVIAWSCGGAAHKDPRLFLAWLDATLEARVMTALASAPGNSGVAGVRPETARNWAELSDPMLYLRWLLTGTDPVFFKAIVERSGATVPGDKAARQEANAWRRLPSTQFSRAPYRD